jgi:hypothetical protein
MDPYLKVKDSSNLFLILITVVETRIAIDADATGDDSPKKMTSRTFSFLPFSIGTNFVVSKVFQSLVAALQTLKAFVASC